MEEKRLGFYELFYIFIIGCLFGYVVEVAWSYYRFQVFINHTALIIGPFNVVYGIAAMVYSFLLYKYRNDNAMKLFLLSFVIGTILEYILSYSMEKMGGFVAWNYSKYMFNINGRVCLRYSMFWGLLGVIWIKYFYPFIRKIIAGFNRKFATIFMYFLIVFLLMDTFFTFEAINRAKDSEKGIPPSNEYEQYLDDHYGVDYLNNMYNNRWGKK